MTTRKHWIDNLRGVCMLAILLDHTEVYYSGANIINYNVYVTDALYLFFFLSGYLMYKQKIDINVKEKLCSIGRSLLIPYLIFTSVIAFPKALAHGNFNGIGAIALDILQGYASWFIAALIVAEIFFTILLKVCSKKILLMGGICLIVATFSQFFPHKESFYIFQIDNALFVMPILFGGYIYHKYEDFMPQKWIYTATALFFLACVKIYVHYYDIKMSIGLLEISNYGVFILNAFLGCFAFAELFKKLPHCSPIEWIGKHSLVYYFFCGSIPFIVGKLFNYLIFPYNGLYWHVLLAFVATCIFSTIVVAIIYRFFPFAVGKKINKHSLK